MGGIEYKKNIYCVKHMLCFKYMYFYDNLILHYHYSVCMKSFLRDPLFYELYLITKVELWGTVSIDIVTNMNGTSLIIIVKMNLS